MSALRVINFLDTGDLAAPKGTPAWCLAVREEARAALQSAKSTRDQVQSWVAALREDDRFRQLADARGDRFLTWDAFCQEPPPHGFGMTAAEVEELIAQKPLRSHGTNQHNNGQEEGGYNITSNERGTNSKYIRRRLKRDAPSIAEALDRGEYKSARAAGIAAGIVKVPAALDVAKKAFAKLSAREREQFDSWRAEQE